MQKPAPNFRHIIKKIVIIVQAGGRHFETTTIVFPDEQLIIFYAFKIEQIIVNISLSDGPVEKEQIALHTCHIDHFCPLGSTNNVHVYVVMDTFQK